MYDGEVCSSDGFNMSITDFGVCYVFNAGPRIRQSTKPGRLRQLINRDPFYWHGLTLTPVWISNHMPMQSVGEISYPFPNVNGCTVEV